ncbi:FAD:protein FMN transferase [Stenotrophomonas sp. LARHCG68]
MLMRAQQIGRETHNAFNIGVGDLVNQWGFGPSSGVSSHLSTGNCLGTASRRPVDDLIEVDEHRCRVRKRGPTVLDLCGIAKGFGVDELGRVLSDYGISAWLVGIDGEMCAHGGKPDGSPWSIALEAPDYDQRATMGVIELTDAAIATSGDYRRWTEIDGARISHTMAPRAGTPLANGVASVTVVARTCADADAYATALMVLGEHAGRDYAQQRGLDALLVVRDGEALRTVGVGCFADGQPVRVSLVSCPRDNFAKTGELFQDRVGRCRP